MLCPDAKYSGNGYGSQWLKMKQCLDSERSHGREETLLLTEQHEHPQPSPLLLYHQNRRITQFPLNWIRSSLIQPDSPPGIGLDAATLLAASLSTRCRVVGGALVTYVLGVASPWPSINLHVPAASTHRHSPQLTFSRGQALPPRAGELQVTSGVNCSVFGSFLAARLSSPVPHLQQTIPRGAGALQYTLLKHSANMQLNPASKYYCRKRRTI